MIIKVVKFKNAFLNTRMREMRKILIVDDDHKETKRLKKMLQPMRQEWEMEFAVSGEEALNFMSNREADTN